MLEMLGKPESLIRYVQDRPGHDRRYTNAEQGADPDQSSQSNDLQSGWPGHYLYLLHLEQRQRDPSRSVLHCR